MAVEDNGVLRFLKEVDARLVAEATEGETLALYLLGRSALILGRHVGLMTKDVDVVNDDRSRLLGVALAIFGKQGTSRRESGLYLEAVSSGLPPLPSGYQSRAIEVPGPWRLLRPRRLEDHDLVVSKLRRFHAGDRQDVRILCDDGGITEDTLRERFELAHSFSDREAPDVIKAEAHLYAVIDYLEGRRRDL
ncbi:MAG: DUF6036 family nucleotidyltransferase [Isosphaeraceae bacterium]